MNENFFGAEKISVNIASRVPIFRLTHHHFLQIQEGGATSPTVYPPLERL